MMRLALLFFAFLFTIGKISGQNTGGNPTLVSFNAVRAVDEVKIDWTIRIGFSCTSVYVMHSTDSVNFSPIYQYPGICGASTEDLTYTFTHTTPSPGNNYYKMELGTYGVSGVIPVYMIMYGDNGITVTTDESGNHEAYYYNPGNVSFTMELFDVTGKVAYVQNNIYGDHVEIPRINVMGIIILRMTGDDGTVYTARFTNSW